MGSELNCPVCVLALSLTMTLSKLPKLISKTGIGSVYLLDCVRTK